MLKQLRGIAGDAIRYIKRKRHPEEIPLIHVEDYYGTTIDSQTIPFNREDYLASRQGPILLNWVIPEMGRGSGGHINIFRFISALERKGVMITRGPKANGDILRVPYIASGYEAGACGSLTAWVQDPEGNEIELMQYTPESFPLTGNELV